MPQQRDPFMWEVMGQCPAEAFFELRTEPWTGRDQVFHIEQISVCNANAAGGDVEIGLLQGGKHFELDTIFNLVAGMWHYAHAKVTILDKWRIYARFLYAGDDLSTSDVCSLHVVGYVLEEYTSP